VKPQKLKDILLLGEGQIVEFKTIWTSGEHTGVTLTFFTPEVTPEVQKLLRVCDGDMSKQELKHQLGLKDDEHFRKSYLLPAVQEGFLEMTEPDKPRSSKQRYRLTMKGQSASREGGS